MFLLFQGFFFLFLFVCALPCSLKRVQLILIPCRLNCKLKRFSCYLFQSLLELVWHRSWSLLCMKASKYSGNGLFADRSVSYSRTYGNQGPQVKISAVLKTHPAIKRLCNSMLIDFLDKGDHNLTTHLRVRFCLKQSYTFSAPIV